MGDDTTKPVASKANNTYTREEVALHGQKGDAWLIIEEKIYDISSWAKRHPGGHKVILSYAGEDASEPFNALHPDQEMVRKYLAPLCIGQVVATADLSKPAAPTAEQLQRVRKPLVNQPLLDDFRKLREKLRAEGLWEVNWWFYVAMIGHILLLEAIAYFIMLYFGTSWPVYILCACILATAQAQAGWVQHDFGHLSVFKNSKWNHWMHYFLICHLKAASKAWWNWRHFLHHAKPNVIHKDPDIKMAHVFILGKKLSQRWAKAKRGIMPYSLQHYYWHLIGPPLLLPIYFHVENVAYAIRNKAWWDLVWMFSFAVKIGYLYGPLLGGAGAFWFYMFFRTLESHWFVYVTQMNHIPMNIEYDLKMDWPTLQNFSTCNVEQSFFNDWFTGHLNFQIEHHLFPTMPRHNYAKANVHVRELYKKHGVHMETKPLGRAMMDIVTSLRDYGEIWRQAYYDL